MMKQEILDLAILQMRAGGYESLSFRKIAEKLDISKANIHHHFKNKESLAQAAVKTYLDINFNTFKELAQAFRGDFLGFIDKIDEIYWQMSREVSHGGSCVCDQIVRDAGSPHSLRSTSEEHFTEYQEVLEEIVRSSIDSGQIASHHSPKTIATQTNMMIRGMRALAQSAPSIEKAHEELAGSVQEWLKATVSAPPRFN